MRRERSGKDNTDINWVLAGMITDGTVCAAISSEWPPEGLFASTYNNRIGGWAVHYYRKYNRPPKKHLMTYMESWARDSRTPKADVEMVEKRLQQVIRCIKTSGGMAADFVLDRAQDVFEYVRLDRTARAVLEELEDGRVAPARERLSGCSRVALGTTALFKPAEDWEAWESAFDDSLTRPLFTYPGALGDFLNPELVRDSFVGILASNKRGKSWWLLDMAFRAFRAKRRVIYFEAGDLSQRQLLRRFGQRALRRPRKAGDCMVPVSIDLGACAPNVRERFLEAATAEASIGAMRKLSQAKKRKGKATVEDRLRIACYPNSSLSVANVEALLREWAASGWVPDVIVVDYADIMATPEGFKNDARRDGINEVWKQLRRISQEFHCLVITATQADANSFKAKKLDRTNFSEDRRKLDHVTAMLALNVTDDDKKAGVTRMSYLARRSEHFTESQEVHVWGCLDIGCPALVSANIEDEEDSEDSDEENAKKRSRKG